MIEKPTSGSRDKAISMSRPRGIALLLAMIVTGGVVTKCNISRFDSSKSNSKKDLQELFTPSADDRRGVKQEVTQYDPFDSHGNPSCIIIPDRVLPPIDQIHNTGPEQGKEMLREASEQETPQQNKPMDTIDPN